MNEVIQNKILKNFNEKANLNINHNEKHSTIHNPFGHAWDSAIPHNAHPERLVSGNGAFGHG